MRLVSNAPNQAHGQLVCRHSPHTPALAAAITLNTFSLGKGRHQPSEGATQFCLALTSPSLSLLCRVTVLSSIILGFFLLSIEEIG